MDFRHSLYNDILTYLLDCTDILSYTLLALLIRDVANTAAYRGSLKDVIDRAGRLDARCDDTSVHISHVYHGLLGHKGLDWGKCGCCVLNESHNLKSILDVILGEIVADDQIGEGKAVVAGHISCGRKSNAVK